jgi:hypothetical protein
MTWKSSLAGGLLVHVSARIDSELWYHFGCRAAALASSSTCNTRLGDRDCVKEGGCEAIRAMVGKGEGLRWIGIETWLSILENVRLL